MDSKELKPIQLYQFFWSNFCEKIRWALAFKKLPVELIEVDPLTLKQAKHLPTAGVRRLIPIINDPNTGKTIGDSTPILRYLEETYPNPKLFPGDATTEQEIDDWCIYLDSKLGTSGRRLAYGQLLAENHMIVGSLFHQNFRPGMLKLPVVRDLITGIAGMMVMARYSLHTSADDGIFQETDAVFEEILLKLGNKKCLVGDEFSAADVTLACLIRPFTAIPYFNNNLKYAPLFAHFKYWAAQYANPLVMPHEEMLLAYRKRVKNPSLLDSLLNLATLPVRLAFHVVAEVFYKIGRGLTGTKRISKESVAFKKGGKKVAENDHKDVKFLNARALVNGNFLKALLNYVIFMPRQQKMEIEP